MARNTNTAYIALVMVWNTQIQYALHRLWSDTHKHSIHCTGYGLTHTYSIHCTGYGLTHAQIQYTLHWLQSDTHKYSIHCIGYSLTHTNTVNIALATVWHTQIQYTLHWLQSDTHKYSIHCTAYTVTVWNTQKVHRSSHHLTRVVTDCETQSQDWSQSEIHRWNLTTQNDQSEIHNEFATLIQSEIDTHSTHTESVDWGLWYILV